MHRRGPRWSRSKRGMNISLLKDILPTWVVIFRACTHTRMSSPLCRLVSRPGNTLWIRAEVQSNPQVQKCVNLLWLQPPCATSHPMIVYNNEQSSAAERENCDHQQRRGMRVFQKGFRYGSISPWTCARCRAWWHASAYTLINYRSYFMCSSHANDWTPEFVKYTQIASMCHS